MLIDSHNCSLALLLLQMVMLTERSNPVGKQRDNVPEARLTKKLLFRLSYTQWQVNKGIREGC